MNRKIAKVKKILLIIGLVLCGNLIVPTVAYVTEAQESNLQPLKDNSLLMNKIYSSEIWLIDKETWQPSLYYAVPDGFTFIDSFVDNTSRVFYGLEVPGSRGWWTSPSGKSKIVKIQLQTGEKEIIYRGEKIVGITPFIFDSNRLILTYFTGTRLPGTPRSDSDRYNICILDLVTLSCEELHRDTSLLLTGKFVHWLDERTFLAPGGRETGGPLLKMDAFTGESEEMLPGWSVFALASFHTTNKMLLVAQPAESSGYSSYGDNIAGFHILDLETFTVSDKLFDTPPFDYAGIPILSQNDEYFIYSWLNNPDESGSVVFDLKTGAVMADLNNIASNTWLPDGHSLIGAATTPDHYFTAVVTVEAQTGEITKLFDIDERVYFTVAN